LSTAPAVSELGADVCVIGSGPGGATAAWALARQGADVLMLERGHHLPREDENWSPDAVFAQKRYRPPERWRDEHGRPFAPGVHYVVGGNSKVWGACLPRFRVSDFQRTRHRDGVSPAWPVSYAELEPHYTEAERLFGVHGTAGADPTEPPRSADYPFAGVGHEPQVAALAERMTAHGMHPFPLPLGIDRHPDGRCIRCRTCDGFPCRIDAKNDAEIRAVRPAVAQGARLETGVRIDRLVTDGDGGRVIAAEGERDGAPVRVTARSFVLAAGAVNSAVVLLRSRNAAHPDGLANASGQVGRNYMAHILTAMLAVARGRNRVVFQKTVGLNDFYETSPGDGMPLGNVQAIGKLQPGMLVADVPWLPRWALAGVTDRSLEWILTTEDLPDPENRVWLGPDGAIHVRWRPANAGAHRELVRRTRGLLRRVGYPLAFGRRFGVESNSHQCGTVRLGTDRASAPLDAHGRAFDVENLYVADAAVLPSAAAMNPGLTIAALALRQAAEGKIT
jgi:choline dehydrogenase-like flavoprotein